MTKNSNVKHLNSLERKQNMSSSVVEIFKFIKMFQQLFPTNYIYLKIIYIILFCRYFYLLYY